MPRGGSAVRLTANGCSGTSFGKQLLSEQPIDFVQHSLCDNVDDVLFGKVRDNATTILGNDSVQVSHMNSPNFFGPISDRFAPVDPPESSDSTNPNRRSTDDENSASDSATDEIRSF
jgi:hypothetical protein